MKKLVFLFAVLFVTGISTVCAQEAKQPIRIVEADVGHDFYYSNLQITSVKQMKQIVRNDSEALAQMRWATFDKTVCYVFDFIGCFAIGYELGMLISGKNALGVHHALPISVGAGSFGIAFLFSYLSNNRMTKGARIYNGNLGMTSCGEPIQLDFGLVPGGVGLTLSF